jgi:hypothetical protein
VVCSSKKTQGHDSSGLSNLNRILPKGEVLPVPVISRVIFGPPLRVEKDETKESFLGKTHAAICALRKA